MAEEEKPEGAAPEGGAEEAPPKKKLSLLTITLGLQSVILLGAAGFIAKTVFMQKPKDLSETQLTGRTIASIRDVEAQVTNVDLETFTVSLGQGKTLKAGIQIEVSDPATAEVIRKRLPAVKAEVLKTLSAKGLQSERLSGKLDLKDGIRNTLNGILDSTKGNQGSVRDVLLQDLILVLK